jgi:cAMP-dependent protein kinase regulator
MANPLSGVTPPTTSAAARSSSGAVVLRPGLPTAYQPLGLARHISLQPLPGGGLLLVAPKGRVPLTPADVLILHLLDGQVRLPEYLQAAQVAGLSPLRGVDLLRRLADAAALGQHPAAQILSQSDPTTAAAAAATAASVAAGPSAALQLPWLALTAGATLLWLGGVAAAMVSGSLGPSALANLPPEGMLALLLAIGLRHALRKWVASAAALPGQAGKLRPADVARTQALAGMFGLVLPAATATGLLLAGVGPATLIGPTAALLGTLVAVTAAPWLPGDIAQWMGAQIGADDFAARVRRFLSRKHARNITRSGAPAQLERVYLRAATLSMLHVFAVLGPMSAMALSPWLQRASHSMMPQTSTAEQIGVVMALLVILAVGTVSLFLISRVLWGLASQLQQVRPRESEDLGAPASADETAQLESALRSLPFLQPLDDQAIAALSQQGRRASYRPGQKVLVQGAPGDRLCWLAQGRVRVILEDESGAEREVATLYPGAFFGETALLAPVPRTATVTADGPVEVLSLSRQAFLDALTKVSADAAAVQREIRTAAAVRSHPLFQGLGPAGLRSVLSAVTVRHLQDGEAAVAQGSEGSSLYAVLHGELRVVRDGKQLATLLPGGFFGELALLGDGRRTASVVAAGQADVVELPLPAVEAAILHDPQAALALLDAASERFAALQAGGMA